jgi:soluble lytic murein transglycosylase-like protein
MLLQRNLRRLRSACSGAALLCGFCTCAQADCFDAASHYHQVNPLVLRAIAWAESHNEPLALHQNPNGTTDYGVMQINSVHLSALGQYGISTQTLMQPCSNVYVAAWHLRHQMDKYGNTLAAVGAYHSETPELRDRYALRIVQILKDWKLVREVP